MTKEKPSSSRSKNIDRSQDESINSHHDKPKKSTASKVVAIIVAVVVALAGGYYYLTGADPLGLFEPDQVTPVAQITPFPATLTPRPATATPQPATPTSEHPPGKADWWHVYFTNPQINTRTGDALDIEGTVPEKLIDLIDNARQSIHIASFEFNLTSVAEALIAAHGRGVEVQWVTDDEHGTEADYEEDYGQFAMLEDAGIEVKDDGRSALMHNKFWIFDGKVVWTGSTNITHNGTTRNNNNVIVLRSPEVARIYEREFQEMWKGKFGPRSPSTLGDQKTVIDGTPVQILFAAEDEVVSFLVPLIRAAEESIRVMAFSFTHDSLGEVVLDRSLDDLDVMGIFETRGSETQYSELTVLACAGVPVRQDGNPRAFHHKVIVIDDETVITGSLNFSNNADDSNDENVVIVKDPAIAARYLEEFDRRWLEGRDPDPSKLECGYATRLIMGLGR
jgi:phosphatidylserine/phosphatidylglycerophosphate/cardiolipin synthase-like enzyme